MQVGIKPTASNKFIFSLPKNSSIVAKILVNSDHIITGDVCTYGNYAWEYTGDKDIIHELGGAPRWMAIVPVHTRIDGEIKLIHLRLPRTAVNTLTSLSGSTGLRGRVFEIKRIDEGGEKFTNYQIIDKNKISAVDGSEDELVNSIVEEITKRSQDEIRKLISGKKSGKLEEEIL